MEVLQKPGKKIAGGEVCWGIIGAGNVCEVKSAPAMQKVAGSRLVAIMRRDGEKARDYALRHNVGRWYTDAAALIADPEVNTIYIATPPNVHLHYTRMAAAAGKPVYVEKPMARTYAECREMIAVCKAANVPLYVAYYRRALPHFVKIRALLAEGAIGAVRTVHISMRQVVLPDIVAKIENNWRVQPEIAGGGYFYDLASHQLDLLDYFFGPITHAAGFAANQAGAYPAEDIVAGSFVFQNGVLGTGNWCFTAAQDAEEDSVSIIGSLGSITFRTFGEPRFSLHRQGAKDTVFSFPPQPHIQAPMIAKVTGDLLGTDLCPSDGISAARTNRVMELLAKKV
jgi:predicted dehydrogenase